MAAHHLFFSRLSVCCVGGHARARARTMADELSELEQLQDQLNLSTFRADDLAARLRDKEAAWAAEVEKLKAQASEQQSGAEAARADAAAAQRAARIAEDKRKLAEERLVTAEQALRDGHDDLRKRQQKLAEREALLVRENDSLKRQV